MVLRQLRVAGQRLRPPTPVLPRMWAIPLRSSWVPPPDFLRRPSRPILTTFGSAATQRHHLYPNHHLSDSWEPHLSAWWPLHGESITFVGAPLALCCQSAPALETDAEQPGRYR